MSHILLGIGGGIAAYKAVEVVRELQRRGHQVRVVMTPSAERFVGAITLTGLTGHPAITNLWDPSYSGEVHVELGAWADLFVVVPATANLLARAAMGFADDAVLATLSCFSGPKVFAPAMHSRMWRQASTQRGVATLTADGAEFVGPVVGALASGEQGEGRLATPAEIADACERALGPKDLVGVRILVTAGPTLEDMDPVRFLGNRSTGKMGYAIARAAAHRGATVHLISGPTVLSVPAGVEATQVRSALEMHHEVLSHAAETDVVIMSAAVADYRPAEVAADKIKKAGNTTTLELVRNPDILAELGALRASSRSQSPVLVGFAVETADVVGYARSKVVDKKCDFIVANHASDGFAGDTNRATFVFADREVAQPFGTKATLADAILSEAKGWLKS